MWRRKLERAAVSARGEHRSKHNKKHSRELVTCLAVADQLCHTPPCLVLTVPHAVGVVPRVEDGLVFLDGVDETPDLCGEPLRVTRQRRHRSHLTSSAETSVRSGLATAAMTARLRSSLIDLCSAANAARCHG